MPDLKISQLVDGSATITGDDLMVLVDAPGGTATTKQTTVTNFLNASVFDTALSGRGVVLAARSSASGLGWIDTDTTLAGDSATKVPTQHAVKTYVDAHAGGTGDVHQADTDASGWSWVLTDTTLSANSGTKLPTQHAVKTYVDALPTLASSDSSKLLVTTSGGVTTLDVTNLVSSSTATFLDGSFTIENTTDPTKIAAFSAASIATATTQTFTFPNLTGTFALTTGTQTLTQKNIVANGTVSSVGSTAVDSQGGGGLLPFHATGAFLGLDFVATEFGGVTANLDLRGGINVANLAAMVTGSGAFTTSGQKIGAWHIGGAHNDALVDCAAILAVATEDFSGDTHVNSGTRWMWQTTANQTESRYVSLVLDHDGSLYVGAPPDALGGGSASLTYSTSGVKPNAYFRTSSAATITSSFGTPQSPAFARDNATYVVGTTSPAKPFHVSFSNKATLKNAAGVVTNFGISTDSMGFGFRDEVVVQADTQTGAIFGTYRCFSANPTVNRINSGTFTSGVLVSFASIPTISTGITADTVAHFNITDVANTGTIATNQIGIAIPVLSGAGGGKDIGIRNASTSVFTPTTVTITASTSIVTHNASYMRLNNTSGGSVTLSSAPTVSDGNDGEQVTIINGSANDVVLQDQGSLASSNLRLGAASRTLSTRDSITLVYDGTIGDWCEIAFSNVL